MTQIDSSLVISICITIIMILAIHDTGNEVGGKKVDTDVFVAEVVARFVSYTIVVSLIAGFAYMTNLIIEAVS